MPPMKKELQCKEFLLQVNAAPLLSLRQQKPPKRKAHYFFLSAPPVARILRRTVVISSLLRLARKWVPSFFLATLSARLSFPTLSSSVILFSYGANPTTSLISLRTSDVRLPSFPLLADGLLAISRFVTA